MKAPSNKWQTATIVGSVWGAFEIVAGSLLHNLAIPLVAGTTLSALGVIILVAGARVFGGKGIFWRAALVCAALKTVSPSPVILSPMIGISLEGFLMEAGVLLLGGNIFGYMLGGGLALISVLGFKFVRLIMIYGTDLVEAYKSVFSLAFSNDLLSTKGYLIPVILFITLYLAIGAFVAYIGYRGGNAIKDRFQKKNIQFLSFGNNYKPPMIEGYKGGIGFLLFHIVWLVFFILSKGYLPSIYWLSGGVVYIMLCIFRYGRVRNLLSRPTFWIVITMVSTISTIFISIGKYGSLNINLELLEHSVTIVIRASVVIISFLCISIELRSKGVSRHFGKNAFSPLANSYAYAHDALPSLISTLKSDSKKVFQPIPLIEKMFTHFSSPSPKHSEKPAICIVTTDRQGGKTTFLKEMIAFLESNNHPIAGFFSEGFWNENGERAGFNIITIPEKKSIPLCDRTTEHWRPYGSYFFNPKAIELGIEQLVNAPEGAIVFIDEIGLFELEGQIWANAFASLLSKRANPIVVSIRTTFLDQSIEKWELAGAMVIDAAVDCPEETVKRIIGE